MSEMQSAENSSAAAPTTDGQTKPAAKRRSSVAGRIVIGILLFVLAIEAFSHIRLTLAQSKLSGELTKAEEQDYKVLRKDVQELLGGRQPDQSMQKRAAAGEELYDVYYFAGILKRRVLCVHYGVAGEQDADDMQREMMGVMPLIPEEILFNSEAVN